MLEDLTFFIGNCEFHGENLLGCWDVIWDLTW